MTLAAAAGSNQHAYLLPASYGQRRLWFLDLLEPASNAAYIEHGALRMRGRLDRSVLQRALDVLVARHEPLRTQFIDVDGEPAQAVVPELSVPIEVETVTGVPAGATTEQISSALADQIRGFVRSPFDVSRAPLFRARLFRLADDDHVLVAAFYHAIYDQLSGGLFVQELLASYDALLAGTELKLPELPIQYGDFAAWQRDWIGGEEESEQLSYWQQRLAGLPPLELPTDRTRPAAQTFEGATVSRQLPVELLTRLEAMAREHNATLFMTLMAALTAVLGRHSGQKDFGVGTPVSGRESPGLASLIGFFVNNLVIRADLAGDPTFSTLLSRTRDQCLAGYARAEVPFERVLERLRPARDLARSPLFSVMFVANQNPLPSLSATELSTELFRVDPHTAKFDLVVTSIPEAAGGLVLTAEYNRSLYERATAERLLEHVAKFLAAVAADPQQRVSAVSLLDAEETARLRALGTGTQTAVPNQMLPEVVRAHARLDPCREAVRGCSGTLSYGELVDHADRIAGALRAAGVQPGQRIGVALPRDRDLPATLLAVMSCGAAYVPLDPALPAPRLERMIEDSGLTLIVTGAGDDPMPAAGPHRMPLAAALAGEVADRLVPKGEVPTPVPENPIDGIAYVIYTSGSTGVPKGVAVSHRNLLNLLASMAERPGLSADDHFAAVTTVSFDIAGLELLGPLWVGGSVDVVPRDVAGDGAALADYLAESGATVMQGTPTSWQMLLDAGWRPGPGLRIWCGGEALPPELANALAGGGAPVWNLYGPTETTIWSTAARIRGGEPWVPLGQPISNTELLVVDEQLRRVPVGVPGELLIGGVGVAVGYWQQPELTGQRFVVHPEGLHRGRVYRTGDIVRWRDGSSLEYLGRADQQVKIRGHRVELAEVESTLRALPEVRDAAASIQNTPAGPRLVGYVIPVDGTDVPVPAALRAACQRRLPEYMVPGSYVTLTEFPRTSNGKLDRAGLPEPEADLASVGYVGPRSEQERALAEIVAQVLGIDQVGVSDDFFEIGGHSLLAARVVSRIRERLGVAAGVRMVFDHPTVAALASALAASPTTGASAAQTPPRLPRQARADGVFELPASAGQRRLWVLHQLDPDSSGAYLLAGAVRLTGLVDRAGLERAWAAVVGRHEALRTSFEAHDGEPVQVVHPDLHVPLEFVDLANVADPAAAAEVLMHERLTVPFFLDNPPLVRVTLVRIAETEHLLLLSMHHSIGDQQSTTIVVGDLVSAYEQALGGDEPQWSTSPIQFADAAAEHERQLADDSGAADLAYWVERLSELPVLDLPTDRPRPPALSYRGRQLHREIAASVVSRLSENARGRGATAFMAAVASFQLMLHRYSGQRDFGVATPVAGRVASTEQVVGYFANTLILRADLTTSRTLADVLDQVRDTCLDAYAHADTPFDVLVERLGVARDLSRTPLAQVGIAMAEPAPPSHRTFGGLRAEPIRFDPGVAKTDLTVTVVPEVHGGWRLVAEYATDIFDSSTVERMLAHLELLLEEIGGELDRPLSSLPSMPRAEAELLTQWAQGPVEEIPQSTLPDLFERHVAERPDQVVVIHGEQELSFAELNRRANQLAHLLIDAGVGADDLIAVVVERSVEMVVAVLAVHKAGGAYLPIDPSYPPERVALLIEDAAAELVLTQGRFADRISAPQARVIRLDDEPAVDHPTSNPPRRCGPGDLAYVIYTSGSTGTPKGVCVEHRSVVNLWLTRHLAGLHAESRVLQFAPFSFDVSVLEMVFTLFGGAPLVIPEPADLAGGVEIVQLINRQRVTFTFIPPSLLAHLAPEHLPTVEVVGSGGEDCPAEVAEAWGGRKRFLIGYGPTECTVFSTVTDEIVGGGHPPIGRPIVNTIARVYDPELRPCPVGVPGELYLGGAGLARGYLRRPDQTAVAFLTHPGTNERLYRTGDVVRWLPDGNLEFIGRIDDQVKVRGFRIELGEIAAAMRTHPLVAEAVAAIREDSPNDQRIVGYVTMPSEPAAADEAGPELPARDLLAAQVREAVQERLPQYMVPAAVVVLPTLPLTPNGKVDRRALPAPDSHGTRRAYVAPRTGTERRLARLMAEALKVEQVGREDDFFSLGGHSLLAARLHAKVRQLWGVELPLRVLFERPQVAALAEYLDQAGAIDLATAAAEHAATLHAEVSLPADIQPIGQVQWPSGASVCLVTGATGFLGGSLVEQLVASGETVWCLVRGADDAEAQQRLEQRLAELHRWSPEWRSRVRAIAGDLGALRFGLAEGDFVALARQIDVIYHCGALVDFSRPYSMLREVNVQGTVEVLRLATLERPIPVHYVSTMSVFAGLAEPGEEAGLAPDRLCEGHLPDNPPPPQDSGYAQSKWVAEKIVALARSRGLPVAVYRPGRIGGDRHTGICSTDDLVSQVIRACVVTGLVPDRGMATDLVPVDYLAAAICRLAGRRASNGRTFHFSLARKVRIAELAEVLVSRGWPARRVPPTEWYAAVLAALEEGDDRLAPVAMVYGPMIESGDGIPDEPVFDTTNTRRLLGEELPPPVVDAEVLGRYVDTMTTTGFLSPPSTPSPVNGRPTNDGRKR
ncbi:amino acid adenylation domain-containing protein [Natronosporangium hydrolyticum]|uniref:Amino acid adenylation domain-containing protein n=1 Tax=Natronosporangium hydrolyticum TaxID=2811111 RepID=A0A895YF04_9ACTN|nr:non-ribosomal peptide synthetase [Natronosporangium hydrolyticum]QSB13993.1 amino acid adenylation domain-containing protein [Natronosporangium hydrolyticum]